MMRSSFFKKYIRNYLAFFAGLAGGCYLASQAVCFIGVAEKFETLATLGLAALFFFLIFIPLASFRD